MDFALFHDSRIGRRSMNQDRVDWAQTATAVLLVVADGMGGHRHGEVAAQVAVTTVVDAFRHQAAPRLDAPSRFLQAALDDAHRAINDYAALRAIPIDDAPRTTCVACVIQDGQACWAHVGDSRLYHIRDGRTVARTLDHSRVQMLVDSGAITPAEALVHPQRNLVYSCLGGDMTPRIDVSPPVALDVGDVLALCSDGAWAPTAERFPAAFSLPPERAVPLLLDAAEAAAGPSCDNLTLIALRWASATDTTHHDQSTQRLSAVSTVVQDYGATPNQPADLSDADIERAVAEIRQRIQNQKPNGASR
jgi:PPM family protein phosphatase